MGGKYKGKFDMGYEKYREVVLANMIKMGIVPKGTTLPPINPWPVGEVIAPADEVLPWDTLSDDQKKLFARMAENYAGFSSYTDHEFGSLLDYLDGWPDDLKENLAKIDKLGGPETYPHYPTGWAQAFNTPYKMFKRYSLEGGVADPLVISWPKEMKKVAGGIRDQYHHRIDIVPTILECCGVQPPLSSRATPRVRFRASPCATRSTTRRLTRTARRNTTPCSARVPSTTRAGRP